MCVVAPIVPQRALEHFDVLFLLLVKVMGLTPGFP
jgi:hypothetical protein